MELTLKQQIELVREFVQASFVDRGMIADIGIISKESNPHATIMLTMRKFTGEGFGQKERSWSDRTYIFKWREEWANIQNMKLEEAGYDVRVDHRSYVERGIDLEPQVKLGYASKYITRDGDFLKSTRGLDRLEDHQRIRRENGERIIEEPGRALKLLRHRAEVFKRRDIDKFAKYHSADTEQYKQVVQALSNCQDLILTGKSKKGEDLYSIQKVEEENN